MKQVSVSELKKRTSAIIRDVEAGQTIEITRRGRPVAYIDRVIEGAMPGWKWKKLSTKQKKEYLSNFWKEADDLARRIGEKWPAGVSAVDAVRDMRDHDYDSPRD